MKKLPIVFLLLFTLQGFAQDVRSVCGRINQLNSDILPGLVKPADAAKQFKTLVADLKTQIGKTSSPWPANRAWVFPLQGYKPAAIGGTNGNGYSDKGYSYLDGNKHGAHPAHDIFINDKNQDSQDDRTQQPVNVLAVDDGIVIACSNDWEPNSTLRGGKFIWIYHPAADIFTYYAHNQAIFVKPGDYIKQGTKIAEVGRTGLNAYKKRSPTHLHFSSFKLVNDLPVPFNSYTQLKKAVSK